MTTSANNPKRAGTDKYNDPKHNYRDYWKGREYENEAEEIAIKRLLAGKHFKHAADIGGGFGRLCPLLTAYAKKVTLTDPSQQQLDLGKDYLKDYPAIDRKLMQADDLKFKDGSLDLVTIIRILHHIPDPTNEFAEIARVLNRGGYAVIEAANYMHARNRLKYFVKGQKLPTEPVDIRSEANRNSSELPFVNHNPKTLIKQLSKAGFKVERTLSVSNLRSPGLKRALPKGFMLAVEGILQPALASSFFGPSIFFLVRRS